MEKMNNIIVVKNKIEIIGTMLEYTKIAESIILQ